MNTLRLRAEHSAQKFYNKRQNEPLEALAGDGAGNVTPTAKHGAGWDYVRIGGDADDVHEAKNSSGHTFAEDDSVLIHWVKRTGLGFYEIIGYSGSAVYDNPSDTTQTTVLAHAAQHQRRDQGQGGFDPLDIYARMVVPLRARPQTSPGLTLHVEAGYNPLTGNYYAGGDSAAFVPPTGLAQAEIDLLYLGADDALHIVAGTPVAGGSPTLPALVLPSVPLAFVYLSTGQTTITESNIYRDPGILRAPVGVGAGSAPDNAEYVTLALNGSLSQERVLVNGTGLQLTDGGANANVELKLADTAVTPATYGDATHVAQFTVDQQGRLTAASNVAISGSSADPFLLSGAGAWVNYSEPHAVYYNGRTYFGYVKSNGDITIRYYEHATKTTSAETVLHAALEVDTHDSPTILIRNSDHRLLVFYSKHGGTVLYLRISTNPEDISAFDGETDLAPTVGGSEITYPSPVQLTGEASAPIYLFWRNPYDLNTQAWWYSKSTDGGATWAARTDLFKAANRSAYLRLSSNGVDRIDFAVSDGHPFYDAAVSIYHFYYTGGSFYKTDGTVYGGALPLAPADVTKVYDGASDTSWVADIGMGVDGKPVAAFVKYISSTDHRYMWARWNGAAWSSVQVVAEGGAFDSGDVGGDYAFAGMSLDTDNPAVVYLSKKVAAQWEIYQYWTVDAGTDWQNIALTTASANLNWYPFPVHGHSNDVRVLWLYGTYTTYTNFSASVYGWGRLWSDEKIKVAGNDATEGYLKDKLQAGSGITLTENNDGGAETLTIAATGGATGANPTAEVGASAVNGAAATFMRSDAAPKLADTAVTPGTYGDSTNVAQITVDQQGRLTAASEVALSAIPTVIYSPLTNGDPVSPGLVFDPANGDVILIAI